MSNTVDLKILQAIERAKLALQLAASQGKPVKVVLTHADGNVAVGIDLRVE